MKDFLQTYKNIIILLVISGLLFWGYAKFFQGENKLTIISAESIGTEVVQILDKIEGVELDTTALSDPTFSSLSDFGLSIQRQVGGRNNPFGPISSGSN